MKRYQTSIPRAGLAIAAISLTALTLSVSIIAPARMDAAQKMVAPAATEVVDVGRIDVIAAREPAFIPVHVHRAPAKAKQQT